MRTIFLFFILTIIFHIKLLSQSTGDYRSAGTGNWNTLATWQRYNGTTWVTPTGGEGVPSSANGIITILNGHTVTLASVNQTAHQMIINSGGQVTIGIGQTLTINNGTGTDLTVNGILINSGTLTFNTGVTATFESGSIYQHNKDGGVIPTATWNANSLCSITGIVVTIPTGMGQAFGNFTWNCPTQTVASTPPTTYNIQGNLTVQNTGTGEFRMGTGTTSINNVLGNYLQSGGTVRISGTTARTLNVSGNFNLSGGTLLMSNAATIGTLNVARNFTHTSGIIYETSTGSGTIVFNGNINQSYIGGGTISNTINFTVNNPAGITLLTSVSFPASLTMTNGNISTTGTNLLTLGNSASVSGGSATSYVSGPLAHNYTTTGAKTAIFPIGKGGIYRPVTFTFNESATTSTTYTAEMFNSAPPSNSLGGLDRVSSVRYYTLSKSAGSVFTSGIIKLNYDTDDGVTTPANLRIVQGPSAGGGAWTNLGGTGTAATTGSITSATAFTSLANTTFTLGSTGTNPLPVELSSFSAVVLENGVRLSWRTETEVNNYGFDVERKILKQVQNDNDNWEKIGIVNGNGNSNSPKNYSYVDDNITAGKYSYRLKQIDNDGQFEYSKTVEVDLGGVKKFELSQNYPNPFNPITTIRFSLPEASTVKLTIYNILGQEIKTLLNEYKEAGIHTVNFDASEINSGMYIYKLEAGNFVQTRKMTLVK